MNKNLIVEATWINHAIRVLRGKCQKTKESICIIPIT